MPDYIGKVCPFCKTAFQFGDDIVVCSECAMPHHKECWIDNCGCTTFGCLGTIQTVGSEESDDYSIQIDFEPKNDAPTTSENHIYCTKCGAENINTSFFCSSCGSQLIGTAENSPSPFLSNQSSARSNDFPSFGRTQRPSFQEQCDAAAAEFSSIQNSTILTQMIGVNSEYYIKNFSELAIQKKQSSWNWSAFLFAPYWCFYRKMYGYGAAALGITFLLSCLNSILSFILLLAGYTAFSCFANFVYMRFISQKTLLAQTMSEPFQSQFIAQSGGVSLTAAITSSVGYIILCAILIT